MLFGYARVSGDDQNLDLQRDALTKAGCDRIFEDRASGARDGRPGLTDALSHLRAGDCLAVWKLDRLGRTLRGLIDFIEELRRRGIDFRTLDGTSQIDTSTAQGRFFFHVMAALAEMERELIRERTNAGLAAARARGRRGGRPSKITKRQLDHAKRLLADPLTTMVEVAASLHVDRTTLYRALVRERDASTGVGSTGAKQ
jgi:DNA invertase Pin-like site-specific DNA recombinase